jgi:O-antigen ligase
MNWRNSIQVTLLLTIVVFCSFEFVLHRQSSIFHGIEAILLQIQWMLLIPMVVWCVSFVFLTFSLNDLPLIGLLLIAIAAYFIGYVVSSRATDAIILLAGVTLGKSAFVLLRHDEGRNDLEIRNSEFGISNFLTGLVLLLAFSSWWHLRAVSNFYHGPRWTGLWNNPNIYGMLMGAGLTLAIGMIAACLKSKVQSPKLKIKGQTSTVQSPQSKIGKAESIWKFALRTPHSALLFVAAGMMAVGLFFSYSRGAWLGTAIGLLYLAKAYGKLKWQYVVMGVGLGALSVVLFWGRTADTDQWYLKRLDLNRPSAQHRDAAWGAAFQMMRDHPFGVGWNRAVETYSKNYSPPEGGAAAITTNDYLMLGTQIGIPALLCFIAYVALCLRSPRPTVRSPQSAVVSPTSSTKMESAGRQDACATLDSGLWTLDSQLRVACRSAAIAMLVAFWFDGGLFKLATASVFWILLELGSERQKLKTETDQKAEARAEGGIKPI